MDFIVATAPASETVTALLSALAPRGKAILLGTGQMPLQFSHLFQTLPVTKLLPFERANEALYRLKRGLARYRIILTMNQDN